MVNHVATRFLGEIPGVEPIGIPLNPTHEAYPDVQFWKKDTWQSIRNGQQTNGTDLSILSLFMEDEFGQPIPKGIQDKLRADLYDFWTDKRNDGKLQTKTDDNGLRLKEECRMLVEGRYPWLRLCEGHWKAGQLWQYFGAWKRKHLSPPPSAKTITPSTPDPNHPGDGATTKIPTESSDGDVSAGSKRGCEDDPAVGSLKKQKGKEVAKSNFHPPRPEPKKVKAKIAKVSTSLILSFCLTDPY